MARKEDSMPINDIYKIDPTKVELDGKAWDDDTLRTLWAREMQIFNRMIEHHTPLLERGKILFDRYAGQIFTDEEIDEYEQVLGKVVIQPRIAKGPIRSLTGQILKGLKSGTIITEQGDFENENASADETEVLSTVMKDMENRTKERQKVIRAIHDSCVSSYPCVLLWEKGSPLETGSCHGYKMTKLPWDSCVFGPLTWTEPDGGDIKEMAYYTLKSMEQLIKNFPDREDQIKAHFPDESRDANLVSSLRDWEDADTADARDTLFNLVEVAEGMINGSSHLVPCVYHLFPVEILQDVWFNIQDDKFDKGGTPPEDENVDEYDYIVRPPEWDDERWDAFLAKNKGKFEGPYERPVTMLWSICFTTGGLILECKKHWYQDFGKLPADIWLGTIVNNTPSGPMDDLSDDVLFNAIAEIEHLDEIRKGSGRLIAFRQGAIANVGELPSEASKTVGFIEVKANAAGAISDNIVDMQRQANPIWKGYSDERKQDMYENSRINESMQGQSAPRQSAIAKNTEIAQALIVNAIYVDNFNLCWENHQNKKLSMIPFIYTEYMALEVQDEKTDAKLRLEVNAPTEYDAEGNPVAIVNDLTAGRYRFRISAVDDSETAKQQQMSEAILILNSVAGPLKAADQSGIFLAKFLLSMDNIYLNKAGKSMMEDAKAQSEAMSAREKQETQAKAMAELQKAKAEADKAAKAGLTVSFKAEDFANYPQLLAIYQELAKGQQAQQMPQPAAPQPAPQPMPQPQGQPAMAPAM
jgi:hypothetical protein